MEGVYMHRHVKLGTVYIADTQKNDRSEQISLFFIRKKKISQSDQNNLGLGEGVELQPCVLACFRRGPMHKPQHLEDNQIASSIHTQLKA
jgi:hypothetical protein